MLESACPFVVHDLIQFLITSRIAGSDTTSNSLSYFFWELSRRPDIMKKLQTELDSVMPASGLIPDITVLQELPYLAAFVKEGMYGDCMP